MRSKNDTLLGSAIEDPAEKQRLEAAEKECAIRRNELKEIYEFLVEFVPDAAESSVLEQKDKELLLKNQAGLSKTLCQLDTMLESISSPDRRNGICYLMTEAIWAANVLGRFSPPIKAIVKMEKIQGAQHMRNVRANSKAERALWSAVVSEAREGMIARPSKEASAIIDGVNKILKEAGHAPVKLDVVRRRLEKVRALQERTNS